MFTSESLMIKTCEVCGKEYKTFPSLRQRFCSRRCQGIWRSRQTGENAANWQGGLTERICAVCDEPFSVKLHVIADGNGLYCSRRCAGLARRNRQSWVCQQCGRKFSAPISQGMRRYCSKRCQGVAFMAEANPNWHGGKTFEPYTSEFNESFKGRVRERDGCQCAICRMPGLDVHHIDYCKEHSTEDNCITLCKTCHGTTNFHRSYWQRALSSLLSARLTGANL